VPPSFEEKLAMGREYELLVAGWLKRRGFLILPVYDYSGLGENKSPKLQAANDADSLVVPDLLIAQAQKGTKWVEVKFKARADFTRKTQRMETGIALRLWRHYHEVKAATGLPVWLMFCHAEEDEIRGAEIADLASAVRVYDGRKMGRGGMAFFPVEALRRLARLSAIRGQDAAHRDDSTPARWEP